MALIARTTPGADLSIGGSRYLFDQKTGERHVTHAEADELRRYVENGGVLKIEITEEKTKKGGDK